MRVWSFFGSKNFIIYAAYEQDMYIKAFNLEFIEKFK